MTRFELNNNVGTNLFTATIEEGVCEQFYASMALQQAIQAGVNLERLHLENAALFGIDFFNVNLSGALFQSVQLHGCQFRHSECHGIVFDHCGLLGNKFNRLTMRDLRMTGCDLTKSLFDHCRLDNFNLVFSDALGIKFKNSQINSGNLKQSSFVGSVIKESQLNFSLMYDCNFGSASVLDTAFFHCQMNKLYFTGSDLERVEFTKGHLLDSTFKQANIEVFSLSDITCDKQTLDTLNLNKIQHSNILTN